MVAVSRMLVTLDRLTADGDLEGLLEYFSEDAVMMPPDEAALIGTRQIGDWHRELLDNFDVDVSHEPLETDVLGDAIIHRGNVRGTLQPKTGGAPLAFDDKYLFVIRKSPDGSLKIWRAIANANPPGDG
ncbi:MAG: nuclear transport factor 2 family protein [Gemmatimonadales bacterium]|jgi:ketosteroid isomerase-like protein